VELGSAGEATESLGSTVVAAAVRGGKFVVGHVGDSRSWLVTADDVQLLTADHSLAQSAVNEGSVPTLAIGRRLFGGAVYRCLGDSSFAGLDVTDGSGEPLPEGSILLLTTDGAHDYLTETDILQWLCETESLQDAVETLAYLAYSRGSPDNITLLACEYGVLPRVGGARLHPGLSGLAGSAGIRAFSGRKGAPPACRPRPRLRVMVLLLMALVAAVALVAPSVRERGLRAVNRVAQAVKRVVAAGTNGRASDAAAAPQGDGETRGDERKGAAGTDGAEADPARSRGGD